MFVANRLDLALALTTINSLELINLQEAKSIKEISTITYVTYSVKFKL